MIYGQLYGSGSGYGRGDGYGDGSGYGSWYGDGYGRGDGYGDGSGYGDGDGSGYGDGDEAIQLEYLKAVADGAVGECALQLRADGAIIAFWRSDKDGKPCNGGTGVSRHVGMVEEEKGPLVPCRAGALHATMQPGKWKGARLWVVILYQPVTIVEDDKFASLKREIVAELPNFYP